MTASSDSSFELETAACDLSILCERLIRRHAMGVAKLPPAHMILVVAVRDAVDEFLDSTPTQRGKGPKRRSRRP